MLPGTSKWNANFQIKRSKVKVTGRQKPPEQSEMKISQSARYADIKHEQRDKNQVGLQKVLWTRKAPACLLTHVYGKLCLPPVHKYSSPRIVAIFNLYTRKYLAHGKQYGHDYY